MIKNVLRFIGLFLFCTVFSSINAFAATCSSSRYKGPDNACHDCPETISSSVATSGYDYNRSTYPRLCGSDLFLCPYNAYKVQYNGQYSCAACPAGDSASQDLGAPSGVGSVSSANRYTWSTAERCQLTTTTQYTDNNGCKYTRTLRAVPQTNCDSNNVCGYPAGDVPDASAIDNIKGYGYTSGVSQVTYELVSINYKSCPAGYGAVNNGTVNATSAKCSANTYSPEGSISCGNVPSGGTVNADQSWFTCNSGNYLCSPYSGMLECCNCPLLPVSGTNVDPINWALPSSSNATSIEDCYVGSVTGSDGSGTYRMGDGSCYANIDNISGGGAYYYFISTESGADPGCGYAVETTFCSRFGEGTGTCRQYLREHVIVRDSTHFDIWFPYGQYEASQVRHLLSDLYNTNGCIIRGFGLVDYNSGIY